MLIVIRLVKKFPVFNGTWRFITVFTTTRHWSLSWARCIQSTPSQPISLRPILILSSRLLLGLPTGFFLSGFPTNILYAFLVSPKRAWSCLDCLLANSGIVNWMRYLLGTVDVHMNG
jgi:hypothetical protein